MLENAISAASCSMESASDLHSLWSRWHQQAETFFQAAVERRLVVAVVAPERPKGSLPPPRV